MNELIVGVAVIKNNKNETLILRRVIEEENLIWCFPGGKQSLDDQNAASAAVRETEEETGIKVSPIQVLGEAITEFNGVIYRNIYIACDYISGEARVLEPHKHKDIQWVHIDNASSMLGRNYRPFVHDYFQSLKMAA